MAVMPEKSQDADRLLQVITNLKILLSVYREHHAKFHPDCNIRGPEEPPPAPSEVMHG